VASVTLGTPRRQDVYTVDFNSHRAKHTVDFGSHRDSVQFISTAYSASTRRVSCVSKEDSTVKLARRFSTVDFSSHREKHTLDFSSHRAKHTVDFSTTGGQFNSVRTRRTVFIRKQYRSVQFAQGKAIQSVLVSVSRTRHECVCVCEYVSSLWLLVCKNVTACDTIDTGLITAA